MRTIKVIRTFYWVYSIYTLFVMLVSDYRFSHAFFGLSVLWFTFYSFKHGYMSIKEQLTSEDCQESKNFIFSRIAEWSFIKYIIVMAICWVFSILAARYYTGRGFAAVLSGAFGGDSAYYSYQHYFMENNLRSFSLSKFPYIIMLGFNTIVIVMSYICILLHSDRKRMIAIVYLVSISLSYAYFGWARGTNFELYIIFILFAYCILKRSTATSSINKIGYFIAFISAGIVMVLVYRVVVMDRGITFSYNICPEIKYNSNSILVNLFPLLVNIGLSVFGYLGYGIYTIGVCVVDIGFSSISRFASLFVPYGFKIFEGKALNNILSSTIIMGAKWAPDCIGLINILGVPLYFAAIYLAGRFNARVNSEDRSPILKEAISVILFIEMLSLPVGNFLVVSSSNKLLILYVLYWYFIADRVKIKIKA